MVLQAKGLPYAIGELFGSDAAATAWRNGCYATLRLTATMYHRFHAPGDGRIEHVTYLSGDTWNVNPPGLHGGECVVTNPVTDAGQFFRLRGR